MITTAVATATILATAPAAAANDPASDVVTVAAVIGLAVIVILNMIKESVRRP
jgi:hypothetical protein